MTLDTLSQFKGKYLDVVRPNLFYVNVAFPTVMTIGTASSRVKWLVQSATLPGRTMGVIEVPFRGVKAKYAGNSVYADYNMTFLQDTNFTLNNAFEGWMEYIESIPAGIRAIDSSYKTLTEVVQLDGRQNAIKNYLMVGSFASDKADNPLGQDANDEASTFDITLTYDYWVSSVSL